MFPSRVSYTSLISTYNAMNVCHTCQWSVHKGRINKFELSLYRASEMIPVSICQVVERLNGIKTHSFQIQQRTWINYWLKSRRHSGSKRSSLVFVPSCPLSLRSFQSFGSMEGIFVRLSIWLETVGWGTWLDVAIILRKKMKSQSNHLWNSPSSIFPESSPPLLLFLSARAAARTTYTGKVASFTVFKICEKIQYFLGLTLNIIMPVDADVHMIFCPKCSWHKPP